jgi:hypothetical protein
MFQVFTAGALHVLESLSKVTGDGGAKAPYAPLKPWPISERERILGQIKKLPFVNDTHYAEWCAWFAQLKEVRKGTLKKFVFNVCRIPANSQKTSCLLGQSHCSYLARLRLQRAQQARLADTPQQFDPKYADEIWTHAGHTVQDRRKERQTRGQNFSRATSASQRKADTEQLVASRRSKRQRVIGTSSSPPGSSADSSSDTDPEVPTTVEKGQSGKKVSPTTDKFLNSFETGNRR